MASVFSDQVIRDVNWWINEWSRMWRGEAPLKIHSTTHIALDGAPQWTPEFVRWVEYAEEERVQRHGRPLLYPKNELRTRTTRAFRKLRRVNVREYEVLYRTVVERNTLAQTTKWLNERAIRNGKADRYTEQDAQVLLVSAVDKCLRWW